MSVLKKIARNVTKSKKTTQVPAPIVDHHAKPANDEQPVEAEPSLPELGDDPTLEQIEAYDRARIAEIVRRATGAKLSRIAELVYAQDRPEEEVLHFLHDARWSLGRTMRELILEAAPLGSLRNTGPDLVHARTAVRCLAHLRDLGDALDEAEAAAGRVVQS